MKTNFILRIYKDTTGNPVLSYISDVTISGITLISKDMKFGGLCLHKSNQKKFKYSIELSKAFNHTSGSHSSPNLSFKGEYIDIIIKNFPRYPSFGQCHYYARNILNGAKPNGLPMGNGFPHQLNYRTIEFIKA